MVDFFEKILLLSDSVWFTLYQVIHIVLILLKVSEQILKFSPYNSIFLFPRRVDVDNNSQESR